MHTNLFKMNVFGTRTHTYCNIFVSVSHTYTHLYKIIFYKHKKWCLRYWVRYYAHFTIYICNAYFNTCINFIVTCSFLLNYQSYALIVYGMITIFIKENSYTCWGQSVWHAYFFLFKCINGKITCIPFERFLSKRLLAEMISCIFVSHLCVPLRACMLQHEFTVKHEFYLRCIQ